MVSITLPDDIAAWAREQVEAGRAESVESLVAQVVHEHRRLVSAHGELVAEAYKQIARGEVFEAAEVDAELDRWIAEDLAASR